MVRWRGVTANMTYYVGQRDMVNYDFRSGQIVYLTVISIGKMLNYDAY